jgi:DNA-binding MarR family transcriptional regulator
VTVDSFDACANELISFVRATKRLAHVPVVDGPLLERPAFMLLIGATEHGPVRPSTLAEVLYLDLSTVSRQLAALETSGWIARDRDPDDRRAFLVRITDEGRQVLGVNLAARRAVLKDLLTDWSEDERMEFARLLGLLNKTLEQRSGIPVFPTPAVRQETT